MGLFKSAALILLANGLTFWLLDQYVFLERLTVEGGTLSYVVLAIFFGLVNLILRPVLSIITLPLRLISLGAIAMFMNAGLLWVTVRGANLFEGFGTQVEISGLWNYVLIGLVLSVANTVTHWFTD